MWLSGVGAAAIWCTQHSITIPVWYLYLSLLLVSFRSNEIKRVVHWSHYMYFILCMLLIQYFCVCCSISLCMHDVYVCVCVWSRQSIFIFTAIKFGVKFYFCMTFRVLFVCLKDFVFIIFLVQTPLIDKTVSTKYSSAESSAYLEQCEF